MSALRPALNHSPCPHKQRGAALMVMLVILVVGATAIIMSSLNNATLLSERSIITSQALAQANGALLGRAVSDGHPGSLPCPDTSNTGTADTLSGIDCPNYLGRLPWKTLGLPDLRDESGERLWYALSPNYRSYTNKINSNTPGTLQIYDNTGTTLLTPAGSEAAAIVFAPGPAVGSQQRGSAANQLLAQNYLETGPNNVNNSISGGPFIAADKSGTFNDRIIIIKTRDIISLVEKRIIKELSTAFASYYNDPYNANKYPNPANFSCTLSSSCASDSTVCIGKIPTATISPYLTNTWFAANQWVDVIYYTAGTNFMSSGPIMGCSTTLNISGVNTKALFIMPGIAFNGQNRGTSLSAGNITNYFEDSENQNLNATYVIPSTNSNDTLHILP